MTTKNARRNGQENVKPPSVDNSKLLVQILLKPIVVILYRMKPNGYFILLGLYSFMHDCFKNIDCFIDYSEPLDAKYRTGQAVTMNPYTRFILS